MSNNTLTYKGYVAKVEYDSKRGLLYGTVQGIRDAVNFESASGRAGSGVPRFCGSLSELLRSSGAAKLSAV